MIHFNYALKKNTGEIGEKRT